MRVKYIGHGDDAPMQTRLFGYLFERGRTVDVREKEFVNKLKNNPSFEIVDNPEMWVETPDVIDIEDAVEEVIEEVKDEVVDFPKKKKKPAPKKKSTKKKK